MQKVIKVIVQIQNYEAYRKVLRRKKGLKEKVIF